MKYIIEIEPCQAGALEAALDRAGVSFDPNGSLCAMPRDSITESVFTGNDLGWLPGAINGWLEASGDPHRIRDDMSVLGPEARFDLLELATMHADWGTKPERQRLEEMNRREWERFREKHPLAVHRSEEEPGEVPDGENDTLADIERPIGHFLTLADIVERTLLNEEEKAWDRAERSGKAPPPEHLGLSQREELRLDAREVCRRLPELRGIIREAFENTGLADDISREAEELSWGYTEYLQENLSADGKRELREMVRESLLLPEAAAED